VSFFKASKEYKNTVSLFVFNPAELLCREAGLHETIAMLTRIMDKFNRPLTYGDAKVSLEHFRALMMSELAKCPLFIAPKEKMAYFEQDKLFGESVYNAFPHARMDITEAGNCWALGRNNAVVYHLMSAARLMPPRRNI